MNSEMSTSNQFKILYSLSELKVLSNWKTFESLATLFTACNKILHWLRENRSWSFKLISWKYSVFPKSTIRHWVEFVLSRLLTFGISSLREQSIFFCSVSQLIQIRLFRKKSGSFRSKKRENSDTIGHVTVQIFIIHGKYQFPMCILPASDL